MDTSLAWLAGFWDGEGSVGFTRMKTTNVLMVQLSHTELPTVQRILDILREFDVRGRGYTYQERDPSKHRDAHYVRVTGMSNALKLGKLLVDYAFTKKRHWEIAIEWAESRIKVAGGVDANGRLLRGGTYESRKYTDKENQLVEEMIKLNLRGPASRPTSPHGRIVV